MTVRRGTVLAASWPGAGLRAGCAASLQVPIGIVVVTLVPALWSAYPLLLVPLLLAGPLAVRRLGLRDATLAAGLAGLISGTIAACSLALAWGLLGNWFWALTSAASAPPMPALPRIMLLPTERISWPQQDILFFQPLLALILGLLAHTLGRYSGRLSRMLSRLLPPSLAGRLRLAFGALIALTLLLGAVGFGMIEEMHLRNHRVQLRVDWQRQLGMARAILDEELTQQVAGAGMPPGADPTASAARTERVGQIFQALGSTAPRPGVPAGRDDIVAVLEEYRPLLEQAVVANDALRAVASDRGQAAGRLAEAMTALGRLQVAVEADLATVLAGNDVAHHQRLIGVMVLVTVIAGLGMWTGERVLEAIGAPLGMLGAHLRRVARGDFSHRVLVAGPDELRQLGASVNQMTADLARLYEVERRGREMAEAVAAHEQELSAAKELWTNTLVHDLKNPLAMIVGWTDLLELSGHGDLTADQREALEQIRQSTRKLEDLVADVNDTFRLQQEALPIHCTPVRPGELLWASVAEYHGLHRTSPDVRVAGGLPPVLADTRLVDRVIHNLIGNAYKHGGANAQVVLIAEAGDGVVRFAVDDDGPGIPPDERERVFERFMQGAGAARGSGLGLAFCKLVVQRLGGRIWADTSPLGGARIAFELPPASPEPSLRVSSFELRAAS